MQHMLSLTYGHAFEVWVLVDNKFVYDVRHQCLKKESEFEIATQTILSQFRSHFPKCFMTYMPQAYHTHVNILI